MRQVYRYRPAKLRQVADMLGCHLSLCRTILLKLLKHAQQALLVLMVHDCCGRKGELHASCSIGPAKLYILLCCCLEALVKLLDKMCQRD